MKGIIFFSAILSLLSGCQKKQKFQTSFGIQTQQKTGMKLSFGRLGAMVFGTVNEESLWAGMPDFREYGMPICG